MCARRRSDVNSDLPTGLHPKKINGIARYFYRHASGKEVYLPAGTTRGEAKEVATLFNTKNRSPLMGMLEKHDKYNKPLKKWLPEVIDLVKNGENLKENAWTTFLADCERLEKLLGDVYTKSLSLEHVNDYLSEYCKNKSANVYNRKISFLNKIFSYLVSESAMASNPALLKKPKSKSKDVKKRKRLGETEYNEILDNAEPFLKVAMELSLQTTHAVKEMSKAKYEHCIWYDDSVMEKSYIVHGLLRIHRQKTKEHDESRVEIPITNTIKEIIIRSMQDNLDSPYIVSKQKRAKRAIPKDCDHHTQLTSPYISKAFSDLRDSLGLYSDLPKDERPTFHEIRALSLFLYDKQGINPQKRAAHSDAKTTKIYIKGHEKWIQVVPAEISI